MEQQVVTRKSFRFARWNKKTKSEGKPVNVIPTQIIEWVTLEDGTEGGVVPPKVVKVLRVNVNEMEMVGMDCPENVDVSGFGYKSPSQIIRRGDKFICVPYNDAYFPGKKPKSKSKQGGQSFFAVKDWMDNHTVPVKTGKRLAQGDKVQREPAPITEYNETVFRGIQGKINTLSGKGGAAPLTIDFTGVTVTPDNIDEIDVYASIVPNPIKIIFEGVDESIFS